MTYDPKKVDEQTRLIVPYLQDLFDTRSQSGGENTLVRRFASNGGSLDTILDTEISFTEDGKGVWINNNNDDSSDEVIYGVYVDLSKLPKGYMGGTTVSSPDGHILKFSYEDDNLIYALINTADDILDNWKSELYDVNTRKFRECNLRIIDALAANLIYENLCDRKARYLYPVEIGDMGYVMGSLLTPDVAVVGTNVLFDTNTGKLLDVHCHYKYGPYIAGLTVDNKKLFVINREDFYHGDEYLLNVISFSEIPESAQYCMSYRVSETDELNGLFNSFREKADINIFNMILDIIYECGKQTLE